MISKLWDTSDLVPIDRMNDSHEGKPWRRWWRELYSQKVRSDIISVYYFFFNAKLYNRQKILLSSRLTAFLYQWSVNSHMNCKKKELLLSKILVVLIKKLNNFMIPISWYQISNHPFTSRGDFLKIIITQKKVTY